MNRAECLDVLAAFQAAGVRVIEYQEHPRGNISAASPWAISARDINGLRVDFRDLDGALNWLRRYWIPGMFRIEATERQP